MSGPRSFRALGPIEVLRGHDGGHTPVPVEVAAWKSVAVLGMGSAVWLAVTVALVALNVSEGVAILILAGVTTGIPLAMLAMVVVLRFFRRRTVRADRSGLHWRGGSLHWNEIDEVVADLVEWRIEGEQASRGFAHAVIAGGPAPQAFYVSSAQEAEALAAYLEFLRQGSAGRPEDVPEAIRARPESLKQ